MIDDLLLPPPPVVFSGIYEQSNVSFASDGTAGQLVLPARANRIYLFVGSDAFGTFSIAPFNSTSELAGFPLGSATVTEREFKWKDFPSILGREWYLFDPSGFPGLNLWLFEIYRRD